MFIRKTSHVYYRGSEQHSGRGDYLILFSWNGYKAVEEIRAQCPDCQHRAQYLKGMRPLAYQWLDAERSNTLLNSYESCIKHRDYSAPGPKYDNGRAVLWALVRSCSLSQCGHFMMGSINIGGTRLTVSGEVGSDGLPDDYQDVPAQYRDRFLVKVPQDVATAYWDGTGHNEVGDARGILRAWALETFKREVSHATV